MCLRAYTCVCGASNSLGNQKVGRPTGEGGSENLNFDRTSFMNAPLPIFILGCIFRLSLGTGSEVRQTILLFLVTFSA